jgi:hypothetical protein
MTDEHSQPLVPEPHERRRRELQAELAALGFCLPGTLTVREIRCPSHGCRCHADPPQLHGPYLAWTRKVNQKTLTHNLTPEQAARYAPWLENNRRLRRLTAELQALSLQVAAEAEGWGEK